MSDDIIVWGKTQKEHNITLEKVLQRLKEKNLTLDKSKRKFNQSKITYYGLVFQAAGGSPDTRLVEDSFETL